jgi:leader peptidase (prepilin peptidase) / N-methyltransferase
VSDLTLAIPAEIYQFLLSPWVLGLIGLCIGSFLNVVIHRLPLMMEQAWQADSAHVLGLPATPIEALNLAQPRSRCPSCGHRLAWHENIPIISFLLLRAKCSACGVSISWRYPLVELLTAIVFVMMALRLGPVPSVLLWCAFSALLIALAGIDWDATLLPDSLTLPLLWAGLVAAALGWLPLSLHQSLWGAVTGYLSLWSVYWLFKLATGKEGMGYGDFKLLAALGAWVGASMILPILLAASVFGALVGITMKFNQTLREGRYVPFGPFLATAGWVTAWAGVERVLAWIGWA